MSRLPDATIRLKSAIEQLSAVAESRLAQDQANASAAANAATQSRQSDDAVAAARAAAALSEQQAENLRGELDRLRADYRKLAQATQTVSNRLDGAVGQLRLVLEDDGIDAPGMAAATDAATDGQPSGAPALSRDGAGAGNSTVPDTDATPQAEKQA